MSFAILPAVGAIAVAATIVHATSESAASRAANGAPGLVASPAPSPRLAARTAAGTSPPNILVIVLDDIGIDQMGIAPFGWNSSDLTPDMPVLEAIAQAGVSFTNFWTAPECSPTRAGMLTGRYGFRTGVLTAIVDPMLPVDQLNPAEITLPKLLGPAGYRTSMIGKYHLGGSPDSTPPGFGYEAPATTAGLDFYDGYWALPPSIDTTIGGQVSKDTYSCGGLGGLGALGAACFLAPDGTHFCVEGIAPFEAMALGGTPLLNADGTLSQSCEASGCAAIDFTVPNAYYAWPRVTTQADGSYEVSATPQREYLTSFISHRTTEWVKGSGGSEPWLAFVTHSSAHTPIQPPPPSLSTPDPREPNCDLADPSFRIQFKRMCESTDRSVGEMLVGLGLATTDGKTVTLIDPKVTNTMIVVLGDNGSLGNTVITPPFDPVYAKQTVYQTGVWTACIVAGPMVSQPNREVNAMVNAVDLFGLIADAAGVDWQASIPPGRAIDSRPMMPYLTTPSTRPIRQYDFAVYGQGTFAPGEVGPCILGSQVVDGLITSPGLCKDNGGCWAGGADQAPYPIMNYCDLLEMGTFVCEGTTYCFSAENPFCLSTLPSCGDHCIKPPSLGQWAIRSGQWKLIAISYPTCLAPPNDCELQFYHLPVPQPPNEAGMDSPDGPWRIDLDNMNPEEQAMFDQLSTELYATLSSEWYCPGDGNKDFRVDAADLAGLLESWGGPGFWDLDESGITDSVDLAMLLGDWNPNCVGQLNPAGQNIPGCLHPAGG